MKKYKLNIDTLLTEIPALEENKEGLLQGGFGVITSGTLNAMENNNKCNNGCNDGCNSTCNSECNNGCNNGCNSDCNNNCNGTPAGTKTQITFLI